MFRFKWLGCVSHMQLSAAISRSLFEAITLHLISRKISLFFHWEAQSFNLLKSQKLMSHFFVSNKIQNIKHHFETNKGLMLFGLCSFICSILQAHFSLSLGSNFCISPYLMSFSWYLFANIVEYYQTVHPPPSTPTHLNFLALIPTHPHPLTPTYPK